VHLRNARIDDSEMLFEWANDSEVRKMAFSSKPILRGSHNEWFSNKLEDPNSRIYIVVDENNSPVGQIRFDILSVLEAVVDVHTNPGLRNKGIGTSIIKQGTDRFFKETAVNSVYAIIRLENTKSIKAFSKANYKEFGHETIDGVVCCRMVRIKGEKAR
jgi:UDP-2,4-diacetamido-2,4,6-trideoxy-beta-L-altropyranose hydrolase